MTRLKSYLDSGAFTPIQVAATAALNGPQECVDQIRTIYRERRDVLIRGLASAGWASRPGAPSGGGVIGRSVEVRLQCRSRLGQELIQGERARLR
jgi:aspartate/methionine/tyrosine aminotransferase